MKPLFFGFIAEAGDSAPAFYRAVIPARGLAKLGHTAWVRPIAVSKPHGPLWGLTPGTSAVEAHVIVLRVWDKDMSEDITDARHNGQIVLFDVDDLVWDLPEGNPARAQINQPGWLSFEGMRANMAACDAVLAATDTIAEHIRTLVDTPIYTVRSGVDTSDYFPHPGRRQRLRVGWLGTLDYRAADFDLLAEMPPGDWDLWWLGAKSVRSVEQWQERYPLLPDMIVPWSPVVDLPRVLRMVDVVLIPAVDTRFNRARSANTGLACAAAGVPFISSPLPEYWRLREEGAGRLADGDWWGQELQTAANLWAEFSEEGKRNVMFARAPQVMARQYQQVVAEVIERRGSAPKKHAPPAELIRP